MVEDGLGIGQERWKWGKGRERGQGGELKRGVMVGDDLAWSCLRCLRALQGLKRERI